MVIKQNNSLIGHANKIKYPLLTIVALLTVLSFGTFSVGAVKPSTEACDSIQSGSITDSQENVITTGYDKYGYNYQAHMFNGTYDSSDRVLDGKYWGDPASTDYADDSLIMKWSDAWLANVDCNNDQKLDRGLVDGVVGGISKGWLTNQNNGDYTIDDVSHHYTYFSKIVWVGAGGSLWGQYDVIQEVYNDTGDGNYRFKDGAPGFGLNEQWTVQS